MSRPTYKGLQEEPARPLEPPSLPDLISRAPTEPEMFLRWAEQRPREEGRYELSRGRVTCTMVFASSLHSRVIRNILGQLDRLLAPDRFDIGISDFAVRTPYGIRSPDIVVEPARSQSARSTSTPLFIVQVQSPSTAKLDCTDKREEYTAIDTLQTYLICSQDAPRAWLWARHHDGTWPAQPMELVGRDGAIALGGLGIELTMAAIFRGIPDSAPTE